MQEEHDVEPADAAWLATLRHLGAGMAETRLREMLPGRTLEEATAVLSRVVSAEAARAARVEGRRPKERLSDRLRREEHARRDAASPHPGWTLIMRRARRRVGAGPAIRGPSPWDAAARYVVALRLPGVVWGPGGGRRREPAAVAHCLGVGAPADVATMLPVGEPKQLYAEPEPAEVEDTEMPPDAVGVREPWGAA